MGLTLTARAADPLNKIFDVRTTSLNTASNVFVIPDQFFGLELEVENVRGPVVERAPDGWSIKNDGSLRGATAREYVSDGPRAPGELVKDVDNLMEALILNGNNEDRCSSFRTSMHVHMDFTRRSDYKNIPYDSIHGVQATALLYYCLEDQFYEISGRDRKRSGFCFPLDETVPVFARFLHDASSAGSSGGRYYGMNFRSLARFGTLEFRHMPLTMDRNKIIAWLDTLCRLKKWAYDNVRRDVKPGNPDLIETPDVVPNCLGYVFHHFPEVIPSFNQDLLRKKLSKLDAVLTSMEMADHAGSLSKYLDIQGDAQHKAPRKARAFKVADDETMARVIRTREELDRLREAMNRQAVRVRNPLG